MITEKKNINTVLVNYESMSDSTAEVANAVGEEFRGKGMQVEVLPLERFLALRV